MTKNTVTIPGREPIEPLSLELSTFSNNRIVEYDPAKVMAMRCALAEDWTAYDEWLASTTPEQRQPRTIAVAGVPEGSGTLGFVGAIDIPQGEVLELQTLGRKLRILPVEVRCTGGHTTVKFCFNPRDVS